jgi:recombination protein RecA
MSQAMRKLTGTIGKTGCCCIFINQLREKIGVMFGNPETTTGGNALKFYASMRLDIRRTGAAIKDKEGNVVGNHVKVKVAKNKLAPPFRIAEFDIMYGEGISKSGEIVDLGVDQDIISKSGAWYGYDDAKIAQGREAAKQFMMDNPEVADEIEAKIKAKLMGIEEEARANRNGRGKTADAEVAEA